MECGLSSDKSTVEQHWEEIGIQLQANDTLLENIGGGRSKYDSYESQFRRMIRGWLRQKDPPPTWSRFVEALERLQICPTLASHLKSKYCKCYSIRSSVLSICRQLYSACGYMLPIHESLLELSIIIAIIGHIHQDDPKNDDRTDPVISEPTESESQNKN